MKKIFLILTLFISFLSQAQLTPPPGYTGINARYDWLSGRFRSLHLPASNGTPSGLASGQWVGDGAIMVDTTNHIVYFYSGGIWRTVGNGSANSNIGSGYRLTIPFTNNVKTLFAGNGALLDSSSNANGITFKADTTVVQKKLKFGADITRIGDSLFLKGDWVNLRDFGAVGNGSTDDKAALVAAVATGKNVFIPSGYTFLITGTGGAGAEQITLSSGQSIFGRGYGSALKLITNHILIRGNAYSDISGIRFIGGGGGIYNAALWFPIITGWRVHDCWFEDFDGIINSTSDGGGAISACCIEPSSSNLHGYVITGNIFKNCKVGVRTTQRADFGTIANNLFTGCTKAYYATAGNQNFSNNQIQASDLTLLGTTTYGIYSEAGQIIANSNTIVGCSYPVYIKDQIYYDGINLADDNIYGGYLYITNSKNIKIRNGNWLVDSCIVDSSFSLSRVGVKWGGTLSQLAVPIRYSRGSDEWNVWAEQKIGYLPDTAIDHRGINILYTARAEDSLQTKGMWYIHNLSTITDTTTYKPVVVGPNDRIQKGSWFGGGGVTDHGALTGLSDDDHTQYALLAGRSGGQELKGGTGSGDNLILRSTNHATKGKILIGVSSAYDDVNTRMLVGVTTDPDIDAFFEGKVYAKGTNASRVVSVISENTNTSGGEGFVLVENGARVGELMQYSSAIYVGAVTNLPVKVIANNAAIGRFDYGNGLAVSRTSANAATSTVDVQGSFSAAYVAKTANYTLAYDDYTVDCTSGTFTITLPAAAGIAGRMYVIKNSGAGTITIDGNASETIDGATTHGVSAKESYCIQSTGANWIIVYSHIPPP